MNKKVITIFGSAKPIQSEEQYITAYKLGNLLAKNGFDVCTGGFNGIMEAASKGAVESGGEALGVTVNLWNGKPNQFITREIKCETLFERINKLIELGDGFVVLQGGTGTLLELAAVWEYFNKGLLDKKPIVSHSNIWKVIVAEMNQQMKLEGRNYDMVKYFDSIEAIANYLKNNV